LGEPFNPLYKTTGGPKVSREGENPLNQKLSVRDWGPGQKKPSAGPKKKKKQKILI